VILDLDASAMIAFLRDELGAQVVAEALLDPDSQCHAHALNLCEVFYDLHRAAGRDEELNAVDPCVNTTLTGPIRLFPIGR